ncbi:ABC transporter substrate-binding protein [Pollutimonas subterranea]|uniref:ABC transporter substrate-binding protein n=1 Tax=Pollutimonas subterranea TaxID=2045210 RepID=A0A2N4U707_9BURK|nr:tripartite tricarboxylate transporter substrate binding protein [Pollutimonas subterranea]PLC50777.1 ABC transporter substrate-binding protein [Pollutimonas subterranea]
MKRYFVLTALMCAMAPAMAAEYPAKPIRLISGYATGGSVDLAARVFAKHLGEEMNQTVVVENRSGASGLIAASGTAKSAPDGYTLYFAVGATFTVMPTINRDAEVKSLEELAPIGGIVDYTNILLVNDTVPVSNLEELITYSKTNPEAVTYGSSGIGSSSHLSGEYFRQLTGAPMTHVPYRGAAPAMMDVIGGQISMFFDVTATAQAHVKGGKVKPLAVTSKHRNAMFPDVPSVAELGYPDYEVTSWFGLFAPKAIPASVSETLSKALIAVRNNADFQKQMKLSGYEMFTGGAEDVTARIEKEKNLWESVLSAAQR